MEERGITSNGSSLEVKRLEWDSGFLGREVYSVALTRGDGERQLATLVRILKNAGAGLAYLHLDHADAAIHAQLTASGAMLFDEKVTYGKSLGPVASGPPATGPASAGDGSASSGAGPASPDAGSAAGPAPPAARSASPAAGFNRPDAPAPAVTVEAYQGGLTDELLGLAILAGHDSRFRKDPRLLPWFEPLYRLWIVNSLNGTMADIVYISRTDRAMVGLATAKVRDDWTGNIGLIATHTDYQGWGIGTRLIRATDDFFRERNVLTTTVVTQRTNRRACQFYEKAGFISLKTEFVYHLWLT